MRSIIRALAVLGLFAIVSCGREPATEPAPSPEPVSAPTPWTAPPPLGLDPNVPVPADNPMSVEKVELGKLLFFDTRLSADGTVACATCHVPASGGTDNRPTSAGIRGQVGDRSAPTVVNSAYVAPLFWDGRAASLEEQAKGPQTNPIEMGNPDHESVAQRIGAVAGYRERFLAAFGGEEVTPDRIAMAIASYERTVLSGSSPYDRMAAGDASALSAEQQQGLALFNGKARCITCHFGPIFADNGFHNIGVGTQKAEAEVDAGRMKVTGDAKDWGAFKTPTLRDLGRTAPYMHDGSEATLEAVVEYYNRGGTPNKNLDPLMQPLGLTDEEKSALAAFLRALDGEIQNAAAPAQFPM